MFTFKKTNDQTPPIIERRKMARYLMPVDVWAIAFGCAIGWGAFVMPATTFLPKAGPAGTIIAMILSTVLMLVIGYNYAWLMRNRPRKGGAYAFTKEAFGRDHAFLCSWFLSLSYLTVVFLNATALFIISRVLLDNVPQIGMHMNVGGIEVYPGEILLSVTVLVIVGILLIRRKPLMQIVQRVLALVLFAGVVILTLASAPHFSWHSLLTEFGTTGFGAEALRNVGTTAEQGLLPAAAVLTLLLLAPWAFVGFEVASLETPHFDFPIKKSWPIMAVAIISAGFVYTATTLVSASIRPPMYDSWQAYVSDLDALSGVEAVPTFYAARSLMGTAGLLLITVTALAAILTGVIGAYRATVRMLATMAEDKILSAEFRGTTFSIIFVMGLSVIFTFLGRNTLIWFVELTSFGATVAYAYTSAAAWKIASKEGNKAVQVTGIIGTVISAIFAVVQLASAIGPVETMCAPSFLLLSVWCLLGFLFYWRTMRQSDLKDFNGVTLSSAILFCLLLYSVLLWFFKRLMEQIRNGDIDNLGSFVRINGVIMTVFVCISLIIMLFTQKWLRERHAVMEREKMQAEESSKAKSQFLFNMSHDIRTPMNAIIGYTHLAGLEENVPPKVREYIEKIDISGKHLLTLINDVLEMSRIESGKMELASEPGDLCEAMETAWEMFREQMKQKEIKYDLSITDMEDRYVVFDRNRFLRVILNLVSNAYKFTPAGGSVRVSMRQIGGSRFYGDVLDSASQQVFAHGEEMEDETEWGAYEIRVKDTGIGMTKEFAENVFEAFARERSSTVSRIEGTGLGMAITKSIVEAMQGTIDVETAPEQGTEFIIRLPFPLCEAPEAVEAGRAEEDVFAEGRGAEAGAAEAAVAEAAIAIGRGADVGETETAIAETALAEEHETDAGTAEAAIAEGRGADAGAAKAGEALATHAEGAIAEGRGTGAGAAEALAAHAEGAIAEGRREDARAAEALAAHAEGRGADAGAASSDFASKAGQAAAKRVLIAEDLEINRQILEIMCENLGLIVESAENGKEAVEKLESVAPGYYDAILMDIQMPYMDGYEATETIRAMADPERATIPIIAVTANAFGEDVRKAKETGMNGHIAKPIDPVELERVLAEVLGA